MSYAKGLIASVFVFWRFGFISFEVLKGNPLWFVYIFQGLNYDFNGVKSYDITSSSIPSKYSTSLSFLVIHIAKDAQAVIRYPVYTNPYFGYTLKSVIADPKFLALNSY